MILSTLVLTPPDSFVQRYAHFKHLHVGLISLDHTYMVTFFTGALISILEVGN